MARPKNTIPTQVVNISFQEDILAKMKLILFSQVEGKVPFGALSTFVNQACKEKLDKAVQAKLKSNLPGGKKRGKL